MSNPRVCLVLFLTAAVVTVMYATNFGVMIVIAAALGSASETALNEIFKKTKGIE